jgi:carboxyl-terminal processing protease
MNKLLTLYLFLTAAPLLQAQQDFKADFDFLWNEIDKNYAYFDRQGTDWDAVKAHYRPLTDTVSQPYYYTLFLEAVLRELGDPHTHLLINTDLSQRLLPSGTDLKVAVGGSGIVVLETRRNSRASSLVYRGDIISTINGTPALEAAKKYLGLFVSDQTRDLQLYNAANVLMAGDYRKPRIIEVQRDGETIQIDLGVCEFPKNESGLLSHEILNDNIGYIRVENSLGNTDLIKVFDDALDELMGTKALILDLRNTPSGGDSNVGMPILGRFTAEPKPYQTHYRVSEDKRWTEVVEPRGKTYDKPVYVLVNYWTGSMGEGMTIGLDAFGNNTVIGTSMAGLLGANYSINLPNSNYGLNITFERLYHVDGTPREDYLPGVMLSTQELLTTDDVWLTKALALINK